MESESKLQSKRTVVARHEKAKDEAIAREKHLSSMLSQKITENNELREKGQGITRNHENMIRDFERQQAKLKEERDILQEELRQVTEEQKKLVQHHKSHRAVLQDIVQQRDGEDATLKEVQSLVRDTRDRFTKVSDELSRLKDESINLDNRMNRLMEDHKATVEVLGRQIEQTRTSLNSERKERQELQNDRDVLQKKIDNLKREHGNFMSEVTSRITRGKEKYLQQTQKKEETNRLVGETEKTAKNKQQQLEKAQQAYNEMTADLGGKVKEGEDQINRYRQELQNVQKATEAEQPLYQEREKFHKEKQELLDKMKKKVVALKKEQQLLQQEITETKEKIEDCKEPRTQLEEELGIRKNDYNNFLKKAGEEMSQCEEDIYVTTSKLDVIMEENERLDNAMNKLQANLDRVNYAIEEKNNLFRAMTNRKEHITTTLKDAWAKDRNMDVKFAIRDTDTVAEITDFENGMQERGEELQGIQSLIEGELDNLTQFLENLRPYNKGF
ncbi:uncharacterized protein TRIADDRAFT_57106 [Trichoplax adhaerens]|uniref:Uncharacterized protein n=1 Tax=Trichoplax adhaerens TaxID=10228 RepID=B3S0M8_TRIAD|nr:hypothetical protein TRIADDRAFT_57106 [Trichoplax adhaerens]EDV23667.1 hypothetical protein TRIADDRAFT_57106 [Trichoplax adhaerens]|eukprot:XP_002113193.1 hypothetical protein TRIADDRAFT_57106 [Trichoplax adhaerens]